MHLMRRPRWLWLTLCLLMIRPAPVYTRQRALGRIDLAHPPPNLLILIADDQASGTLGCEGDPREATPRLDQLAREGVLLQRAYCNAPVCTASRQSFLTGLYPHAVGVTRLGTALSENETTLADWLGDLGYVTAAFGKMHFNSPLRHGFQKRLDVEDWEAWLRRHPPEGGDQRARWRPMVDPVAVWLNAAARDHGLSEASMFGTYLADQAAGFFHEHAEDPFLMVVGFTEPHAPFPFPREYAGRYPPSRFSAPPPGDVSWPDQPNLFRELDQPQIQGIQAAYFTSLAFLDHQVGRILDALKREGIAENTVVVYLSDNGYFLGQHGRFEKHSLREPAVRVPVILRWPGHLPAGARVTGPVELVDLMPTLIEELGLPAPVGLQGRSLCRTLRGEASESSRPVLSVYLENEEAMIHEGRYKLIVQRGERRRQDGMGSGRRPSGPVVQLYDLVEDPEEMENRAEDPGLAAVRQGLMRALHERLTSTRGRRGPVPPSNSLFDEILWCLVPRDGSLP